VIESAHVLLWDLIVMTYIRRLRAGDAGRFARALRPQGIFVYENNNVGKQGFAGFWVMV
jgi:hypothetical protein